MSILRPPLRYLLNACDIDRHPSLAPIGDWLADFFERRFRIPTHDCPCCMAVRILLLTLAGTAAGFIAGVVLS